MAGEDPAPHARRPRPAPSDVDKLLDICDNISPAITWPPKQTTICPLGPSAVSPIASAVLRFRTSSSPTAAASPRSPCRSTARPTCRRPPTVGAPSDTHRHRRAADGQRHRRRPDDRGRQGRAGHRRRRAQRRLHPALLLPPADDAGGHVPHVHRRDRHRPRPGPPAVVHDRVRRRHDGRHRVAGDQEGAGGRARVPAGQPPARLPGVRQGRRVPAAGPDDVLRAGREPLRRGEAPLREADPGQRPGAARPRALHPVRPLHPLRRRGGGRPADPLHGPGQPDPGQHLPRPPLRQLLQRQHRADLPGGGADRHALPVQGPALGPRAGRVDLHVVLGRLPGGGAVEPQPGAALPGRRRRRRQLGLAVRQGPLRLRGGQQRGAARQPAGAGRGPAAQAGHLERGAAPGGGRHRQPGLDRRGPERLRRHRRRPAHQRVAVRLGQAGQGRHRVRQRRRPAGRRPAGRGGARPAPGHHRRRLPPRAGPCCCSGPTPRRSCRSCSCGCATPSSTTA